MKYLMSLVLYFVFVNLPIDAFAQQSGKQKAISKQISSALGKGSVSSLANFFPVSVGIAILEKSPVYYSKAQAEVVLRKFIEEHKVQGFQVAHTGGRKGAEFTIGNLITKNGAFRVTFFLKETEGQVLIKNLIIDKK